MAHALRLMGVDRLVPATFYPHRPTIRTQFYMSHVVEVSDLDHLSEYRMVWNALLRKTPRLSFFHTYDWLNLFWKHFGERRQFRVLVVKSYQHVVGIVPLCVTTERHHFGSVRVLTYPLSDWGMWYGPLGSNQAASMFLAMRHVAQTRRDWDMIDLRWIDAERSDRGATDRGMQSAGWRPQKSSYQQSSVVEMNSSWDDYLRARSPKLRSELRRQLRLVHSAGNVRVVRYRPEGAAYGDANPRWDLFEACQHVAERSWQSKSRTGNTLSDQQVRSFLRDCHLAAVRQGMLDLSLLTIDNQPLAYTYNYQYDGRVFGLRMGYDRTADAAGTGTACLAWTLKDSFDRGDRAYDLGIGNYAFKRRLRTDTETSYRFSYYPKLAWRSQGVRLTRWLKRRQTNGVLSEGQAKDVREDRAD